MEEKILFKLNEILTKYEILKSECVKYSISIRTFVLLRTIVDDLLDLKYFILSNMKIKGV